MGGVLSPSKPDKPAPAPIIEKSDNNEAEAKARQEALERQRRGIESNIRTSYKGILKTNDDSFKRKKLLGE